MSTVSVLMGFTVTINSSFLYIYICLYTDGKSICKTRKMHTSRTNNQPKKSEYGKEILIKP